MARLRSRSRYPLSMHVRSRGPWLALLLLGACGDDDTTATDTGGRDAAMADSGSVDRDAFVRPDLGPPLPCDFADPRPPPADVRWAAPLDGTGADTLGGHGHDDGFGAVGYCPGERVEGEPFYELVAVGFETDEDRNGDGDQADGLGPDFWSAEPFEGVGESGGRVNVYVDVLDEAGVPLSRDSAPELALLRELLGSGVERIPLDAKPPNEFQTNFPMTGGGTRYGVQVEGASDRVINMRLPVNHHVAFAVVFRRIAP